MPWYAKPSFWVYQPEQLVLPFPEWPRPEYHRYYAWILSPRRPMDRAQPSEG